MKGDGKPKSKGARYRLDMTVPDGTETYGDRIKAGKLPGGE